MPTSSCWPRPRTIRARVLAFDGTDLDAAHILGDRLHAHVRFEERVLFPLLERALDEGQLADLGRRVLAAERRGVAPADRSG